MKIVFFKQRHLLVKFLNPRLTFIKNRIKRLITLGYVRHDFIYSRPLYIGFNTFLIVFESISNQRFHQRWLEIHNSRQFFFSTIGENFFTEPCLWKLLTFPPVPSKGAISSYLQRAKLKPIPNKYSVHGDLLRPQVWLFVVVGSCSSNSRFDPGYIGSRIVRCEVPLPFRSEPAPVRIRRKIQY